MEQGKYFINYRKLWKEIQKENYFMECHTRSIRGGTTQTVHTICQLYQKLLNNRNHYISPVKKGAMPSLYTSTREIARVSGYHPRSVQSHLRDLRFYGFLEVEKVYGESKYRVVIPLKYFFKASNVKYHE
ncbi:hypothetical protein [Aquimarina addita]|uniref:hypothetical protein n=1 Tax=Aquimarina addita TaxID=870485 RepID=UPI0031E67E54